jgi:hypothetical protein
LRLRLKKLIQFGNLLNQNEKNVRVMRIYVKQWMGMDGNKNYVTDVNLLLSLLLLVQ